MDPDRTQRAMLAHLEEQARFAEGHGSPLFARLCERFAHDYEARGPVFELIGEWSGHPRADAVALRLGGALHCAALTGRDPALASAYPEQRARADDWDIEVLWPLAREFFARERAWVEDFIRAAPQTNETRRSIVLLLGFLTLASQHDCEFDLFELGASAGLNLCWDRFRYETSSWSWGEPSSVQIDTHWQGPPPPLAAKLRTRTRAACDLKPLDVRDPAQRLRLRSYIWPDQLERLRRFDAAVQLALRSNVSVDEADAASWLEHKLDARAPGAGCIVYCSIFMQYPPRETRRAIEAAITSAGARATKNAPLAWLRFEPEAMLGGPRESTRILLDLVTFPSGERRVLAIADGHVNAVQALG